MWGSTPHYPQGQTVTLTLTAKDGVFTNLISVKKGTLSYSTMAQNKVNQIMKEITPALTQSLTSIIGTLVEGGAKELETRIKEVRDEYNKKLDSAEATNKALGDKIMGLNSQIEELTAQLADAQKGKAVKTVKPSKPIKGIRHKMFDKIRACVEHNKPIYLCGPAGTGKTQLCKEVADDLGLDFYMAAKVDDEFKLVGYMDGHGKYNETAFYKAFKFGGLFMFDELDASDPNAAVAANVAIANRYFTFPNGEMVTAHENFRIIAAGNTFGTGADDNYTGRQPLDASTIDRFGYIFVDYDERVELACAKGNKDIVDFIHDLRKAIKKAHLTTFTISYRAIINLVDYEEMFGTDDAVQMAITKGLDNDNVKNIARNMTINNKYVAAFSKSATTYANAA